MIYFSLNQPIFYVLFRCLRFVSVLKCLFSAFWNVKRNQGKPLRCVFCKVIQSVINRNSNDISQFFLCRTIDLFGINFYFTIFIKFFSIHIHLIYHNINESSIFILSCHWNLSIFKVIWSTSITEYSLLTPIELLYCILFMPIFYCLS